VTTARARATGLATLTVGLATLGAGVALAGCSSSSSLDIGKLKRAITQNVEAQAGVRVRDVRCPADVTESKGATFSCTVVGTDGTQAPIQVVQKDAKGNVHFGAALLHVREAEAGLLRVIDQRSSVRVDSVSCPEILLEAIGRRFRCTFRVGARVGTIAAMFTDVSGHFSFNAHLVPGR
jgi:Domain of unknown function (DUF4333)